MGQGEGDDIGKDTRIFEKLLYWRQTLINLWNFSVLCILKI